MIPAAKQDPARTQLLEILGRENAGLLRDLWWIHRRVDSLAITEQLMIRWRISIDFTIPDARPFETSDGRKLYYLPVSILAKWPPVMRFDLRDEDDRPLPLLTRRKNRT